MNAFRSIRACMGLTQSQLAAALGMTQGNFSHYEQGRQQIPPDVARRVIEHAATLGVTLTFDHIYGDAELPPARSAASPETEAAKAG